MNQNIKTQHDDVISLIRLMAMCMIITCHIMQYYDMGLAFWFNVGVQIFLCISGFLYGKREIQDAILFISSGFKKILKDYYIFIVICIIIYKIFYPELMPNRTVLGLFFGYGSTDGLGHLWFVSCILCCYFITPLLDKFEKKRLERGKEQKFLGGGVLWIFSHCKHIFNTWNRDFFSLLYSWNYRRMGKLLYYRISYRKICAERI